jgi:hypothetical protein
MQHIPRRENNLRLQAAAFISIEPLARFGT